MMRPEQLYIAFADLVTDVCKHPFREAPITQKEWLELDERWDTMCSMNIRAVVSAQASANQEEKKS